MQYRIPASRAEKITTWIDRDIEMLPEPFREYFSIFLSIPIVLSLGGIVAFYFLVVQPISDQIERLPYRVDTNSAGFKRINKAIQTANDWTDRLFRLDRHSEKIVDIGAAYLDSIFGDWKNAP